MEGSDGRAADAPDAPAPEHVLPLGRPEPAALRKPGRIKRAVAWVRGVVADVRDLYAEVDPRTAGLF
ncbi:MAG TPA: hypothetical protein VHB21_13680, partial [Minicystis sp.]|nr:hypothetical protein [Minicystis sp.]